MNLLLLPGNSKRHKFWLREVEQELAHGFTSTIIHNYAHWDTNQEFADLDLELSRLKDEIVGMKPYVIFAKSIGSILAIKGVAEQALQPTACVFVGFPIKILDKQGIKEVSEWLRSVQMPVLIIQNDDDPLGSWEEVSEYLNTDKQLNVRIIAQTGNTHDYTDFQAMKELIGSFIAL